jgi:hypothetical protein
MLKQPASFVLASLRGSTYRSVRLAPSLAAALLVGLFEHPAEVCSPCPRRSGKRASVGGSYGDVPFEASCVYHENPLSYAGEKHVRIA